MKCSECENIKYCDGKALEPEIMGCTSGEPFYLTENVANNLSWIVLQANRVLGLDAKDYLNEIVEKARFKINAGLIKDE